MSCLRKLDTCQKRDEQCCGLEITYFLEDGLIEVMEIIHLPGVMESIQLVLPFEIALTNQSLTAHRALAQFGEYLLARPVPVFIDHESTCRRSKVGYDPSAHVLQLVFMLSGGGRTLEDLRVSGNEQELRDLPQLAAMPSNDAKINWLRHMGAQTRI